MYGLPTLVRERAREVSDNVSVNACYHTASNNLSSLSIFKAQDSSLGTEAFSVKLPAPRRGGWEVCGGLKGGGPPSEPVFEKLKIPNEDLPAVSSCEDSEEVQNIHVSEKSVGELFNDDPVGGSFDSDSSSESWEYQIADDCEINSKVMETVTNSSSVGTKLSDVYDFNEDSVEVSPKISKQIYVKEIKCCNDMCLQQSVSFQLKATLTDIQKRSSLDKKQFLLDHLIKQEEMDIPTHGFQFHGIFFCKKSLALVSGLTDYIIKEASRAFERGQVSFVHGNSVGMRETEAGLGFVIWMKRHCMYYGNQAPDEDTIILSACYSLKDLYQQYKEESPPPLIQISTFYRSFKLKFGPFRIDRNLPHIRISSYSSHSKCERCILLEKFTQSCKSEEDFDLARSLKQSHKQTYRRSYQAIQEKRMSALYDQENHIFIQGKLYWFDNLLSKLLLRYSTVKIFCEPHKQTNSPTLGE